MQDTSAVAVAQAIHNLLEYVLGIKLFKSLSLLNKLQQVTTPRILHHHQEVFGALKHFKKSDNVRVANLFEDEDLLEDFFLRKVILHVVFVDCLDRNVLASEFVNAQCDLTEGTLANQLHEFIKVKCRSRDLFVLLDESFVVLYKLLAVLHDLVVQVYRGGRRGGARDACTFLR